MQYARVVIALAAVLAVSGTPGVAEEIPELAAGSRVRVEVSIAEERLVGRLLALDDRNLKLQVEDEKEPRLVRREDITALAGSGGRRSRGRGALIGAGIGIACGAAMGLAAWKDADDYPGWMESGIRAIFLAPIGAVIGLVIPPGERWEDLPLEDVQLSVGPVPGRGAGVFVTGGF